MPSSMSHNLRTLWPCQDLPPFCNVDAKFLDLDSEKPITSKSIDTTLRAQSSSSVYTWTHCRLNMSSNLASVSSVTDVADRALGTDHPPCQIKTRRKKNVKKGIQFCLMVCGASGTGIFKIVTIEFSQGLTIPCRPYNFREHSVREASSSGQRCRRL